MTPKEKAEELRNEMYLKIPAAYDPTGPTHFPIAKECALIAVDEILNLDDFSVEGRNYWQQVKTEIEKL